MAFANCRSACLSESKSAFAWRSMNKSNRKGNALKKCCFMIFYSKILQCDNWNISSCLLFPLKSVQKIDPFPQFLVFTILTPPRASSALDPKQFNERAQCSLNPKSCLNIQHPQIFFSLQECGKLAPELQQQ